MDKLKRYRIYWSASVDHYTDVEAFDETDAMEQFDSRITEDMLPDEPLNAELNYVEERKPAKKKAKVRK